MSDWQTRDEIVKTRHGHKDEWCSIHMFSKESTLCFRIKSLLCDNGWGLESQKTKKKQVKILSARLLAKRRGGREGRTDGGWTDGRLDRRMDGQTEGSREGRADKEK